MSELSGKLGVRFWMFTEKQGNPFINVHCISSADSDERTMEQLLHKGELKDLWVADE